MTERGRKVITFIVCFIPRGNAERQGSKTARLVAVRDCVKLS